MAATQGERADRFRALHEGETFVMPNPWDAGSAKVLEALGFEALATTSSGFAFTLGRPDGSAGLEEVAAHVRELVAATSLPLSVDLENGYGAAPEDGVGAVLRIAEAGAVGGSIEDYDPEDDRIYDFEHAVVRVAAAVEAAAKLPFPFTLTARAENHLRGGTDLEDTIARLRAFESAGADVVYAPGLRDLGQLREVCAATSAPVNALAHPGLGSVGEIAAAGARRISVGGSLAWAAVEAMADAAERIRDGGDLSGLGSPARIREWLAE